MHPAGQRTSMKGCRDAGKAKYGFGLSGLWAAMARGSQESGVEGPEIAEEVRLFAWATWLLGRALYKSNGRNSFTKVRSVLL